MAKSGKRPAGIKNETCGIQLDAGYSSRIVTQNRRNKTVSIDGPTLMAGVFRNEALGWLDLDAIGLCDASLDSELSAGLKAIGYQAACETDWKVDFSGSPDNYCFDRTVPGVVAERIVRRYSSKGKSGLLRRIFIDFLRGQAGVGLSRLMAGSHGESDNRFAEKLVRSIQERDRILQAAAGNFGAQRNSPRESGRVLKRAA
jgi:hypothetical protein